MAAEVGATFFAKKIVGLMGDMGLMVSVKPNPPSKTKFTKKVTFLSELRNIDMEELACYDLFNEYLTNINIS